MYVCMYVCIYIYMYDIMYIYIITCIYKYNHIYILYIYILSSVSSIYAMLRKSPKALNIAYKGRPFVESLVTGSCPKITAFYSHEYKILRNHVGKNELIWSYLHFLGWVSGCEPSKFLGPQNQPKKKNGSLPWPWPIVRSDLHSLQFVGAKARAFRICKLGIPQGWTTQFLAGS